MTHPRDQLLDDALPAALALVCAVRDSVDDAHTILTTTTPERLHALTVVLACMVPDDVPHTELLAWTHDMRPGAPTVHGDHAERVWTEDEMRAASNACTKHGDASEWAREGRKRYRALMDERRKALVS